MGVSLSLQLRKLMLLLHLLEKGVGIGSRIERRHRLSLLLKLIVLLPRKLTGIDGRRKLGAVHHGPPRIDTQIRQRITTVLTPLSSHLNSLGVSLSLSELLLLLLKQCLLLSHHVHENLLVKFGHVRIRLGSRTHGRYRRVEVRVAVIPGIFV
jgi:hypothetical protein